MDLTQPLHTAPSNWPTRSRSIIRCHGISISNFRIPNYVWGMGYEGAGQRGIGHPGSDLVGHGASDGGGVGHSMSDNLATGGEAGVRKGEG